MKHRFIIWGEYLGSYTPDLAYGRRWVLDLGIIAFRLHLWYKGKLGPQEAMHSHAWWFLTFILKGKYFDATEQDENDVATKYEECKAPTVRFRPARHTHYVWPDKTMDTLTFVISGRPVRDVFYYACNREWKQDEWHDIASTGANPCDVKPRSD